MCHHVPQAYASLSANQTMNRNSQTSSSVLGEIQRQQKVKKKQSNKIARVLSLHTELDIIEPPQPPHDGRR